MAKKKGKKGGKKGGGNKGGGKKPTPTKKPSKPAPKPKPASKPKPKPAPAPAPAPAPIKAKAPSAKKPATQNKGDKGKKGDKSNKGDGKKGNNNNKGGNKKGHQLLIKDLIKDDGKLTKKDIAELTIAGVPQDKILNAVKDTDSPSKSVVKNIIDNNKKDKSTKGVKPSTVIDPKLSFSSNNNKTTTTPKSGGKKSGATIVATSKDPPKVQSTRPTGVGAPRGEYQETPISIDTDKPKQSAVTLIEDLNIQGQKLKGEDVTRIANVTGLTPEKVVKLAENQTHVKIGSNALANALDAEGGDNDLVEKKDLKDLLKSDSPEKILEQSKGGELELARGALNALQDLIKSNNNNKKDKSGKKDFFDTTLRVDGLKDALKTYDADQLLDYYDRGKLKIGKGALSDLRSKSDEIDKKTIIGGYGRIDDSKVNPSKYSAQDPDDATGIYYKTYEGKGGKNMILKVGNLKGHRYEGSVYKDMKIVDYDATIENYDPSKLGFVKEVDKKGVAKFKTPDVKRQDYNANTVKKGGKLVRSEKQREEYALRGISDGGRVKVARIKGKKTDVATRSNGLLKRLTLSDDGTYKTTKTKYPTEIKSSSYSDLLASNSGIASRNANIQKNLGRDSSEFKSKRDKYIKSGREQLNN